MMKDDDVVLFLCSIPMTSQPNSDRKMPSDRNLPIRKSQFFPEFHGIPAEFRDSAGIPKKVGETESEPKNGNANQAEVATNFFKQNRFNDPDCDPSKRAKKNLC